MAGHIIEPIIYNISIPPFWPDEPALWFAVAESHFALAAFTDTQKYYHIVAVLDKEHLLEVKDILTGPPDYEKLKDELIKRMLVLRKCQVEELLINEQMGSKRPSEFLRHLQKIAGSNISEDVIRIIWILRLPKDIQDIVLKSGLSLDALAVLADNIHDSIGALAKQVTELTRKLGELTVAIDGEASLERSPHRSERSRRRYPVCWYHFNFGVSAKKCEKPCNFNEKTL